MMHVRELSNGTWKRERSLGRKSNVVDEATSQNQLNNDAASCPWHRATEHGIEEDHDHDDVETLSTMKTFLTSFHYEVRLR